MMVKDGSIYVKANNGKPIIPTIFTKVKEASDDEDDENENEDEVEGGGDGDGDGLFASPLTPPGRPSRRCAPSKGVSCS